MKLMNLTVRLFLWLCLFACVFENIQAQPVLNFKRIFANRPQIELYFTVGCDGTPAYFSDKSYFKVVENGIEVRDFDLWCHDPQVRCAASIAFVLDGGSSMAGIGNAMVKAAGNDLVDRMDGVVDEAAVLAYADSVTVVQSTTVSNTTLHNAINAMPAAGHSVLLNGVYAGLLEVIQNGVNPCRCVVVIGAGQSDVSGHTVNEITALALQNRIRIFTIGAGTFIDPTQLEPIAASTGGKYYSAPTSNDLAAAIQDISTSIFYGFQECVIIYTAKCKDGGTRVVDLSLQNFCGGSDAKTKTYKAPKDTSSYSQLRIRIASPKVQGLDTVHVPIEVLDLVSGEILRPASFTIRYDTTLIAFAGIAAPPGSVLAGVPITATPIPGGVACRIMDKKMLSILTVPAMLAELTFATRTVARDTTSSMTISDWVFEEGCFIPWLTDGVLTIVTGRVIPVAPALAAPLDSSINQKLIPGFVWNTAFGADDYQLQISRDAGFAVVDYSLPNRADTLYAAGPLNAGTRYYWRVRARNVAGDGPWSRVWQFTTGIPPDAAITGLWTVCEHEVKSYSITPNPRNLVRWSVTGGTILQGPDADTVTVQWAIAPSGSVHVLLTDTATTLTGTDTKVVRIVAAAPKISSGTGSFNLCEGERLTLDAGAGYTVYRWSNGDTTRKITVGRTGAYWVHVETIEGCAGNSDTALVNLYSKPPIPIIVRNGIVLSTATGPYRYQWYRNGQIIPGANGDRLNVLALGSYTVILVDSNGCSNLSDPFDVNTLAVDGPPEKALEMQVYPTPVQDQLAVRLDGMAGRSGELTLVDVYGRVLRTMPVHPAASGDVRIIDVSRIGKGVYLLQYADERIVLRKRIIRR